MMGDIHAKILADIRSTLDVPLIQNDWRGYYVEQLVGHLLGAPWTIVAKDWSGHDLEHPDGTRVEVKQSAARQSWTVANVVKEPNPRFSIRPVKGYYEEGTRWTVTDGRRAHIHVFSWHPVATVAADHRDVEQWLFYVVDSAKLPPQQRTIGLSTLSRLCQPCKAQALRQALEAVRMERGAVADTAWPGWDAVAAEHCMGDQLSDGPGSIHEDVDGQSKSAG